MFVFYHVYCTSVPFILLNFISPFIYFATPNVCFSCVCQLFNKECMMMMKSDFIPKSAVLRFWPLLCGTWRSGATYDDHLRLIGKRVVLPISVNFFSLCVTAEALMCYERILFQNRQFRSNGDGWPKISGRRGRPSNRSSSGVTRLGVTRGGNWWCRPSKKTDNLFSHRLLIVMTFFSCRLLTPPVDTLLGVTPD